MCGLCPRKGQVSLCCQPSQPSPLASTHTHRSLRALTWGARADGTPFALGSDLSRIQELGHTQTLGTTGAFAAQELGASSKGSRRGDWDAVTHPFGCVSQQKAPVLGGHTPTHPHNIALV